MALGNQCPFNNRIGSLKLRIVNAAHNTQFIISSNSRRQMSNLKTLRGEIRRFLRSIIFNDFDWSREMNYGNVCSVDD